MTRERLENLRREVLQLATHRCNFLRSHASSTTHRTHRTRTINADLTKPYYSPDLNPVEWVWAHVKRSLANLAVVALDRLEALVRNRLKRLQYRPETLDGFIAGTGLTLDDPASP
nr:hypothetical protein [Streptomyces hirsutus]